MAVNKQSPKSHEVARVRKANELINASYRLTAGEQKIILKLVSDIRLDDKDFKVYRFQIKEFEKLLGVSNNAFYSDVKDMTSKLMKKVFTIKRENGKDLQIAWLSSAEYMPGEGVVELCFDPKLKPYLLQLKERFTDFELADVMRLKSSYSIRIFELLQEYVEQGLHEREFMVDDLKFLLGIAPDEYKLYHQLKQRVISPAQKELFAKSDIWFDFEEIVGEKRRVVKLRFLIRTKGQQQHVKYEQISLV